MQYTCCRVLSAYYGTVINGRFSFSSAAVHGAIAAIVVHRVVDEILRESHTTLAVTDAGRFWYFHAEWFVDTLPDNELVHAWIDVTVWYFGNNLGVGHFALRYRC